MQLRFNVYRKTPDQQRNVLVDIQHQATPTPERCALKFMRQNQIVKASQGFCAVYDGNTCLKVVSPG